MKIFTQSVYILCRDWKFCAAASEHIFYVCGCFWKHLMFFKEHAAASEKYQRVTALKENVQLIFFVFKQMCGCS